MSEAKIDFKVGAVSFTAEGSEKWVSEELGRILQKVPELANVNPPQNGNSSSNGGGVTPQHTHHINNTNANVGTLAGYLKQKNADESQRRKFLATAAYLHKKSGDQRLTTGQVKQALSTNNQGKLANASASLNDNVGRGHCEKDGKSFFVTEAGWAELG